MSVILAVFFVQVLASLSAAHIDILLCL